MKEGSPLENPKVMEETLKVAEQDYGLKESDILKRIKAIKNFSVLDWEQLKNYECPSYRWRVQNLIQDKKIIVVAGSSAVYKSWLLLYMGLCVAKGVPFLDNFPVEQGDVLYIDRENSIPELQNRAEMIANGMGISTKDKLGIYFLSEQSLYLNEQEDIDFVANFIKEKNIKFVVIDTYRRVVDFEENDANMVSLFFTGILKPICERTGVSMAMIHHHKKGKSEHDEKELLRGSSDLVNFVDGVIQITRKGSKIIVKQTKNRSGKEIDAFEVNIKTDEEEYFKFEYMGQKQDLSASGRATEALILWFTQKKIIEFKTKDAQEVCFGKGIKKVTFFSALGELEKRGMIIKNAHGKYKVQENKVDSGIVQSSVYKNTELLNKLSQDKSDCSNSSFEQSELLNKSDRDIQYFEAKECENIKECSKEEVLEYLKEHPEASSSQLIEKFGTSVIRFKKEGLF